MKFIKMAKMFIIITTIVLFLLLSSSVFAAYDISSNQVLEFARISRNANLLYLIRTSLLILSILFMIIVITNLDHWGELPKLKIIFLFAVFGILTNLFLGNMYLNENAIERLYKNFKTNDFCYMYQGELLTFRFEEEDQNVILVCQKNRFENKRINKTIQSILTVLLKQYNLPPTLYNSLINTNTSSEYITFERNPEKTDFEKLILDNSYKFIRITFNENELSALNPSGMVD